MMLILLLFLSQQNEVEAGGSSCPVKIGSNTEYVPYCKLSSWLPWECGKCSSSQHNLTQRKRAICCPFQTTMQVCLQTCKIPENTDSETMQCGNVCEPFFNSTTIPPPTTTKLTTRLTTTPATQRPTTKATPTAQSTTTTPPTTETSTIITTTPTTTTRNPSTTANTLKPSTTVSTTELTTESTITIASTQATQHVVLSGNVSSISKEDKGSDQKWCVLGPWKLHSDTSSSLSICTIVLICVLVFLVTVLVGIIVGIVRFKKGQTSSDSTLVTVKPKDSGDMSVEIPSQENLQEKNKGTGKR